MNYEEQAKAIVDIIPTIKGLHNHESLIKITKGEFNALIFLNNNGGAMMPKQLASATEVSSARMTAIIRGIEEKGFVKREDVEGDRRKVNIVLTEKGKNLIDDIYNKSVKHMANYLEKLGEEDAEHLVKILKKTKDILADYAENVKSQN